MAVRVVTDSSAGLPQEIIDELGIMVVDLHILEGQGKDGAELSTSGLNSLELAAAFGRAMEQSRQDSIDGDDDGVLVVVLSKELSSTWSAAASAAGVFDEGTIKVIDSGSAGMVLGAAVMSAARLALDGADLAECHRAALDTLKRANTWIYLHSVEELRKSGRMSTTAALISAALLATKPIMSIEGGKLELVGKTRTQTKAFTKLVDLVASRADGEPAFVAIQHHNALAPAEHLMDLLEQALSDDSSFMVLPLNDVVAVHTGPGAIGVSVVFSSQPPDDAPSKPHTFGATISESLGTTFSGGLSSPFGGQRAPRDEAGDS